jgi:hypothetical protein
MTDIPTKLGVGAVTGAVVGEVIGTDAPAETVVVVGVAEV